MRRREFNSTSSTASAQCYRFSQLGHRAAEQNCVVHGDGSYGHTTCRELEPDRDTGWHS